MKINEDPDELGYWIGEKPVNPWDAVSSLIVCNSILPPEQQAEIESAALLCHQGHHFDAERQRYWADYHSLGFREDADIA